MRKLSYIVLLIAGVLWMPTNAQEPQQAVTSTTITLMDSITPEQEQQFLYYFYEAERWIHLSEIEKARPLVEFCNYLNPEDATVNSLMGDYARVDKDMNKMLYYYKKAFELESSEYWKEYNTLLLKLNNKKAHSAALKNLNRVAKENPKNDNVRKVLYDAYMNQKMYKEALVVLNQLDSIIGYGEESAFERVKIHMVQDDEKQAIAEIERYLDTDPNNFDFIRYLLELYSHTDQPAEKRIKIYELYLRIDGQNLAILNNLAWELCLMGRDLERAEQLSRKTILADPRNPIYLDTYAWIMYNLGDLTSAQFYIERAMDNMTRETKNDIITHYKAIRRKCKK